MDFIDEARITLKAGKGGNGIIAFHRAKFLEFGGPDGGNGGKGADIIFRANRHLNTLGHFRYKSHYKGACGKDGSGDNRKGAAGEDLIVDVPLGTQIFDYESGELLYDMIHPGQKITVAHGGRGGVGNAVFKNSVDRAPRKRTLGQPGEEAVLSLRLKVLSNVGLLGLPNAGKSTFLAATTAARPKIADYPFTTLHPQLGVARIGYEDLVIADIPGLIEGASEGIGLGHRFLRHIERCEILLHLIDCSSNDVITDYDTVLSELIEYNEALSQKKVIIAINKIDLASPEEIADQVRKLQEHSGHEVVTCSAAARIHTDEIVNKLFRMHKQMIAEKMEQEL